MAMLLLGSLIAPNASLLPEVVQVHAPVQLVPSARMSWLVAPLARTPLTAACICAGRVLRVMLVASWEGLYIRAGRRSERGCRAARSSGRR